MSHVSSRVNAFLERANTLSKSQAKNSSSPVARHSVPETRTPTKPPKPTRTLPRESLPEPKRPSSTPKSTPTSRGTSSPDSRQSKLIDLDTLSEVTTLLQSLIEERNSLKQRVQESQAREEQVIATVKELLKQSRQKDAQPQDAELAFKLKSEQILRVVKEEALVMDKKIFELQEENKTLKARLEDNIQLVGGSESLDAEVVQRFEAFETDQSQAQALCVALAKKLVHERTQRQTTEQQAADMIAQQDKLIASMQERLKNLEGKSLADTMELVN